AGRLPASSLRLRIALALAFVATACAGCHPVNVDLPPAPPGLSFIDQPVNQGGADLAGLDARITIAPDSTTEQGLIGFVGLLLEIDDRRAPAKPPVLHGDRSIGKYRPKAEQVQADAQTGKTLYQGKVTKGFNAGGNYLIFSANPVR